MGLLEGKFAIITGAASKRGIGKATARLFAEHGATVALLGLDAARSAEAAADIGPRHVGLSCDVTDRARVQAVFAGLLERWGQVDILFNNAGFTQSERIMQIEPDDLEKALHNAINGTLNCAQALIPHFRERRSGTIINMSSVAAQRGGGIFGGAHYVAAKAGVAGMSKAMARELAPDNVRVNVLCPGFIDTDINGDRMTDEMKAKALAGIAIGRAGHASEVAGCALFLASDLSSYCTGIELDVNGGSHIH